MSDDAPREHEPLMKQLEQAKREFRPAFRTALPYMLLGLFIGFALLLFGFWLEHLGIHGIPPTLVEHLGVGFIVSAIAVFGYEWGAHITKTAKLASKLSTGIELADQVRQTLATTGRLVSTLEQQETLMKASARNGLQRCLLAALSVDKNGDRSHLKSIAAQCEQFVHLVESLDARGKWIDANYIRFIHELFGEIVIRNATSLAALWPEGQRDGEEHILFPLKAPEIADMILAAHMQALKKGDVYFVISDLTSWNNHQLQRFRRATQDAVESEGVVVRRIFDLKRHKKDLDPFLVREILKKHVRDSREWKDADGQAGYEVRALGPQEYANIHRKEPGISFDAISHSHFGLFICQRNSVVRVRVEIDRPDLSDLALATGSGVIDIDLDEQTSSTRYPAPTGIIGNNLTTFKILYNGGRKLHNDEDIDKILSEVFSDHS